MRKVFFALLFAVVCLAQNPRTAEFPGAVVTDEELLVGNDRAWSILASTINDSTLSISVATGDGLKFPDYSVITIQNEQILICSVAGDTLTVCSGGRGFSWTVAAQHLVGIAIRVNILSWHHNQLAAELKAIEESLIGSSYIGTMIRGGGVTASFPAWKRSATGWEARLADDSADTSVAAANFLTPAGGAIDWTSRGTIHSSADGRITLSNDAEDDFDLLQAGGTTSAFPAWKRVAAGWAARTADDGADALVTGFLTATPSTTTPGLNFGSYAGDPSSPSNGDAWYNSSTNKFRCYENGGLTDCIGAGGGGYYQTVDDEDSPVTQRAVLNFEGAGVTCADDTDQTTCTIPSGAQHPEVAIGGLPAASGVAGDIYVVNDAANKGTCTVASGSDLVACISDGSNWIPLAQALTAGASGGVTYSCDSSECEIDIDTAVVPRLAAANVWTGTNDFGGAIFEVQNGTAAPLSTDCDADAEKGRLYQKTDGTTGQQLYACEGLANGWVLQGDGGGTPDIDNLTNQDSWATAATKITNDFTVSGVEVDFENGASEGFPLLAQSATPPSGECDAAAEYGRLYFDTDLDTDGSVMVCTSSGWKDIDDDGAGGGGETAIRMLPDDAKFGGTTDAALLQCPEWCEVLFSTGDEAIWAWRVPDHYSGTITAEVQYKMVSGAANYVEWSSEFKCVTPGDAADFDAASFDTQDASADDEVPGTAGYVAEHTWTVSNDSSIAAGDFCSFRLERTAPTGTDATGDAELLGVALTW